MKNGFVVIFSCVFSVLTFAQESSWEIVKNLDEGYRIEFPSKPVSKKQPITTDIGEVEMHMYMLDNSSNPDAVNLVLMTAFTEYPKESFDGSDLESQSLQDNMLDGSVNGALKNVNGTLINSKKETFNGFNARDAKIEITGGYFIRLKSLLIRNKIYMIQAIYLKTNDDNPEANRFFNSFELIKTREKKE